MLDFNPDYKEVGKTITVSMSARAREFLRRMVQEHCMSVSGFVNKLVETVAQMYNNKTSDLIIGGHKYRECKVLLRAEVAEYIENWCRCGKIGKMALANQNIRNSTPLEIAKKISFIIANDTEVQMCDSNVYGWSIDVQESKIKRCEEKARELPEDTDL